MAKKSTNYEIMQRVKLEVARETEMIKLLSILCFQFTLMACASQKTIFNPFAHGRTDYQMYVSFLKLERRENGDWLITGRVTDRESGDALPGANVLIAESRDGNLPKTPEANPYAGTATDREGYFEIRSAYIKREDVIMFNFIGYRRIVCTISDFIEMGKKNGMGMRCCSMPSIRCYEAS